jgi:phosphonate transport system permease protein
MIASKPHPLATKRALILGLALLGVASFTALGLSWRNLWPSPGGWLLAGKFLGAAFQPAWEYESGAGAGLWTKIAVATWTTIQMAAAATGLSILCGGMLGLLAARRQGRSALLSRAARLLAAMLRSVHELLWALLFLCALGLTPLTAVIAISLPYTGTLGKIFSEMLEEAPRDTAELLRVTGASGLQQLLLGMVPRVMADLVSYSLYRFECGLRAAAVMGFLGVETLGLHLAQAFEVSHYREVWSYLYALLALILCFDFWSAGLRMRLPR